MPLTQPIFPRIPSAPGTALRPAPLMTGEEVCAGYGSATGDIRRDETLRWLNTGSALAIAPEHSSLVDRRPCFGAFQNHNQHIWTQSFAASSYQEPKPQVTDGAVSSVEYHQTDLSLNGHYLAQTLSQPTIAPTALLLTTSFSPTISQAVAPVQSLGIASRHSPELQTANMKYDKCNTSKIDSTIQGSSKVNNHTSKRDSRSSAEFTSAHNMSFDSDEVESNSVYSPLTSSSSSDGYLGPQSCPGASIPCSQSAQSHPNMRSPSQKSNVGKPHPGRHLSRAHDAPKPVRDCSVLSDADASYVPTDVADSDTDLDDTRALSTRESSIVPVDTTKQRTTIIAGTKNSDLIRGERRFRQSLESNIELPTSSTRNHRCILDEFLVNAKLSGMSYRDIRREGGFVEAESTLRGRFRTLTKTKSARVRKPRWTDNDVSTLE